MYAYIYIYALFPKICKDFLIRLLVVTYIYKICTCHFSQGGCFDLGFFAPFAYLYFFMFFFFLENCLFFSHQIWYRFWFLLFGHIVGDILSMFSFSFLEKYLTFQFYFTEMVISQEKVFEATLDVFWGKFPLFIEKCSIFLHELLQRYWRIYIYI